MFSAIIDFLLNRSYFSLFIIFVVPPLIYYWYFCRKSYWEKHGVKHFPGLPLIGNLWDVMTFKKSYYDQVYQYYNDDLVNQEALFGYNIFFKKAVFIREPELIKNVLVKDFNSFSNRHTSSNIHSDLMGAANLFFLKNPMWREMRKRLTPVFAGPRLKKMYYLVHEIGESLKAYVSNLELNGTAMEFKELAARYTTDIIASCAFGVYANSIRTPSCNFRASGKSVFDFSAHRAVEFTCFFTVPELVPYFNFMLFPKKMQIFLRQSIKDIMQSRESSGGIRNDLIDALIELKNEDINKTSTENELVFQGDVLVAQAAIFFAAGFETSSSLMAFTLFELSRNPDVQKRLRTEIKSLIAANNNELSFDVVNKMEYLQMVFSETLRLYPTLPYLDRLCEVDDYSVEPYHTFKIPKGMPVLIPIFAIHRDAKYYPNPLKYDPERFSPENKDNIVPYTYMPFGLGPHSCIGEQMGLLQSKVGIINILREHYVEPIDNNPTPMVFYKKAYILQSEGGINLKIFREKENE